MSIWSLYHSLVGGGQLYCPHFHRYEDWGLETLSNLSEVTELKGVYADLGFKSMNHNSDLFPA